MRRTGRNGKVCSEIGRDDRRMKMFLEPQRNAETQVLEAVRLKEGEGEEEKEEEEKLEV